MKTLLQWLSDKIAAVFPQFSAKKNTGAIVATVCFAGVMTLVDTVFLASEASFLHTLSLGLTSVLKLGIASVYAGIFASLYPVREKNALATVQPVEIFNRATRYLALSSAAIFAGGNLFSQFIELDRSEDIARLFFASLASLAGVAAIVQQFQWIDALIAIRRTEMTGKFRTAAVVLVTLLVVSQVLSGMIGFDNQGVGVALMIVLGVFFVMAIWRLPWLATFAKDQKWRALGLSAAVVAINGAMLGTLNDDERTFRSLELLLPGLRSLILLSGALNLTMFLRVSASLLAALPTATIIDRKINEVRSLSYLSRTISQVYDLERLLSIVTTMIQDVCGATSSWIELRDEDTGVMNVASQLKITQQQLQMLYKDGILRSILDAQPKDSQQALYFEALDEERAFDSVYPYTVDFAQSLMTVPLMLDNERIGTVCAAHRDKFAFEFEDVSLLAAFASNISIAIENARLFESSLEQERYKREMMLARQMQQKLLPKELPTFAAFDVAAYASPALEVGGDYYDCVRLKDGSPCLIVGDVSGKGISAAFYMAELKGVALAVAKESSSPKDLLERINTALLESVEKGSYITITAAMLDEQRHELVLARAGHTPIAVYDHNADSIQLYTPKGFGVALVKSEMFNASLEELRVPMTEGNRCLIFTDGVNEAINGRSEEFGYEPVCLALRADLSGQSSSSETVSSVNGIENTTAEGATIENTIIEDAAVNAASQAIPSETDAPTSTADLLVGEVVRRVVEFVGDAPQHDDITLIGIVAKARAAAKQPSAAQATSSIQANGNHGHQDKQSEQREQREQALPTLPHLSAAQARAYGEFL